MTADDARYLKAYLKLHEEFLFEFTFASHIQKKLDKLNARFKGKLSRGVGRKVIMFMEKWGKKELSSWAQSRLEC